MKHLLLLVAGSVLVAASANAAPTPHQFDLECTGTAGTDHFHKEFAIDLDRGAFGVLPDLNVRPIVAVTPAWVRLEDGFVVLRTNGEFSEGLFTGKCVLKSFTPLPPNMF